jgi:rhodanese-related sulfurtransferase
MLVTFALVLQFFKFTLSSFLISLLNIPPNTAGSFPLSNLRQDRTTAALVRIRTDPNKVLILYDNDEKQAQQAALLLLGKQYTSVAILTGGLTKFAEKFPELLVGPSTAAFTAPPQTTRPARSSLTEASSKLTASALAAHGSPVRSHAAPSTQGSARMAPSVAGGASIASRRTAVSTASRASHISKSRFVSVGAAMAHLHIADVAPPTALQRLRDKLSVGVDVGHDQVSTASVATRRTAVSMRR